MKTTNWEITPNGSKMVITDNFNNPILIAVTEEKGNNKYTCAIRDQYCEKLLATDLVVRTLENSEREAEELSEKYCKLILKFKEFTISIKRHNI